jgi:hypothetical protein
MTSFSRTSIVYNEPNKIFGLPPFYYRLRDCDTNMTSNTPANQYQKLKLIQNTVRVPSSLYTSNLGPLNAYRKPTQATYGVCWNQMSDRPVPSVQTGVIPTGSNSSMNRRHTSVTSSRPGCQAPGGVGCDIKHNSYDRYLNRLKGKGPLRRGAVPATFGVPIPFNPAFPIYGGKTIKTNIVNSCDCPIENKSNSLKDDVKLYYDPLWQPYPSADYSFSVGMYVYAKQYGNDFYTRALVISVINGDYTVEFDNGIVQIITDVNELKIYFPCNCNETADNGQVYINGFLGNNGFNNQCLYPTLISF